MMTREETIHALKEIKDYLESDNASLDCRKAVAGLDFAISALRPVSREQLERMRGEWMFKPFYKSTSRGAIECQECQECKGSFEGSVGFNFCPNCGAPMTDEAVDMMLRRWREAVK